MARRGKGLRGAVACPVLTISPDTTGPETMFLAKRPDGLVVGKLKTFRKGKSLIVEGIHVDRDMRRCGLGTRLYETAATWGCKRELLLRSDTLRTVYSDGFWQKQVKKGRARCARPTTLTAEGFAIDMPVEGRSGCDYYKLKSCALSTDLSGRGRGR